MARPVTVEGLPFFDGSCREVICEGEARRRRQGFCSIVTPNALMLAEARKSRPMRELLRRADLRVPDGEGVLWAAKREGTAFACGKRAGVELGEALAAYAAKRGRRLFLYGGKPGVAEEAAERLARRHRGLHIVGVLDGYGDAEEAARCIAAARADIIFVCLGFPKQERWIERHKRECGGILCGLGGSLDVYAGRVRRAPTWWRRRRLEWLYRCLREPRRFLRLGKALSLVFPFAH